MLCNQHVFTCRPTAQVYTLETFSCAECRYHISEEDDTYDWHNEGLFDVPRATITDGVVYDHNSPRIDYVL